MGHQWSSMTIDGFGDGDTDVAARLASLDQTQRDAFDELVMSPLVNGMVNGVLLLITGHADRIDSGLGHAEAMRQEGAASYARAQSAQEEVLAQIREHWLDGVETWDDLPGVANFTAGRGAVDLAVEPISEDDRRRNRRVAFMVCQFWPDA